MVRMIRSLPLLIAIVWAGEARSGAIGFDFSAMVTSASTSLAGFAASGSRIDGRFTYSTASRRGELTTVNVRIYRPDPQFFLSLSLDGRELGSVPENPSGVVGYSIGVSTSYQNSGDHSFGVSAQTRPPSPGIWPEDPFQINVQLFVRDTDGNAFANDELPLKLDLGDFEHTLFIIEGHRSLTQSPLWRINADLTDLARSDGTGRPIPEPAAGLAFALGCVAVACALRSGSQ